MKSKEEILKETMTNMRIDISDMGLLLSIHPYILPAMQTYAEQQSVEFGEFLLADYDEVTDPQDSGNSLWQLKGTKQQYTTSQLLKIWKDETGK